MDHNAYAKPATALNILRETIMGRELFDYAFKEYAQRWAFKHPTPADFFRTMEDASAIDLDWFWRGWFYTTDHCDMKISKVTWSKPDLLDPQATSTNAKNKRAEQRKNISEIRYAAQQEPTYAEIDTTLYDFYSTYDNLDFDAIDQQQYNNFMASLSEDEKQAIQNKQNYYEIEIERVGGLVMPVILEFQYTDGTNEIIRIPAEIWKRSTPSITKTFVREKEN